MRWLVDPLDGTANFVHDRAAYAVSVSADQDGEPFAGAVVIPEDDRWITGGPDGALSGLVGVKPGRRNPASPGAPLAESLVTFGFPVESGESSPLTEQGR